MPGQESSLPRVRKTGPSSQFTQELKLDGSVGESFDYVAGIYWFREDNRTEFGDVFTLAHAPGGTVPLVLEDRILENTTHAIAVYTQWDWHLTLRLTATLGERWTDEDKEIEYTPNANSRIATPAANRISTANIRARGTTPDQIQPFGPEKVWSYELGLRSEWFERRLRANLTAFQYDADDFQLPSAFTTAAGSIAFLTRSFAALRNTGVEVKLVAAPVEGLDVFATVGL